MNFIYSMKVTSLGIEHISTQVEAAESRLGEARNRQK